MCSEQDLEKKRRRSSTGNVRRLKTRLAEGDQSILDAFHEVEADERFLAKIRDIKERMMPVFQRLEALRVTLAKHEVPKTNLRTWAPGYARIDSFSDTLLWFVTDKRGSTEPISRQSIIDGLREHFQFRILKELSVHFPAHLILISKRVNG